MDQVVEFGSQKELEHTQIQPEHDDHDARHASVQVGKAVGVAEEEGDKIGSDQPSDRDTEGAGKHVQEFCLPVGQDFVDEDKENHQHKEDYKYPDTQDEEEKLMSDRQIGKQMIVNLFAEYQDDKGQHQRDGKQHRIECRDHAEMEIVTCLPDAVNLIDTVGDREDGAAGGPEYEEDRDGHDRDRRTCIDLLHDLHDHIRRHARRQRLQDAEHIIVGQWGILNDGEYKDGKWKGRENNIISRL